jgi:hypothetical protein
MFPLGPYLSGVQSAEMHPFWSEAEGGNGVPAGGGSAVLSSLDVDGSVVGGGDGSVVGGSVVGVGVPGSVSVLVVVVVPVVALVCGAVALGGTAGGTVWLVAVSGGNVAAPEPDATDVPVTPGCEVVEAVVWVCWFGCVRAGAGHTVHGSGPYLSERA